MSDTDDLKRPPILLGRPFTTQMAAAFRRVGYDVAHTEEPGRSREADAVRLLIASPEAAKGHGGSSMQITGTLDAQQLVDTLARTLKTVFMNDAGQLYLYDDGEPIVVPLLDPPPPTPRPRTKAKARPRRPLS
jgi:hypothetical protein